MYFRRSIEANPNDATHLGNYALFLTNIRKEYDKAEEYFEKSIGINPKYANCLGNYAYFLMHIRKKHARAVEYYERAINIDPDHANNLGNYSGLLLGLGRNDEGFAYLERAMKLADDNKPLKLECFFYEYAHAKDGGKRKKSLDDINKMIKAGDRSPGWDLSLNVERAKKDGHPAPEFLETLANVIAEKVDASELEKFPEFKV